MFYKFSVIVNSFYYLKDNWFFIYEKNIFPCFILPANHFKDANKIVIGMN